MPFSLFRSPSPLEKVEKKLVKEGKKEDSNVMDELKDLNFVEKEVEKAHKALQKAQRMLAKRQKEENKAVETLNKATAAHDVSAIKLHDAETDLKLKQDREAKLHQDLAAKRTEVDGVVSLQKAHNEAREARLSQIHHERAATHDTHASEVSSGSVAASRTSAASAIDPHAGETIESPVAEGPVTEPSTQHLHQLLVLDQIQTYISVGF
ncbi:hypothetical protein CPB85DRAFT_637526 [Mucidula mucida]|nr:hypothetical protein CPB85DRAFT_637526 [Mucidula mucida]